MEVSLCHGKNKMAVERGRRTDFFVFRGGAPRGAVRVSQRDEPAFEEFCPSPREQKARLFRLTF